MKGTEAGRYLSPLHSLPPERAPLAPTHLRDVTIGAESVIWMAAPTYGGGGAGG